MKTKKSEPLLTRDVQRLPTKLKISGYRPYQIIGRDPDESTYKVGDDKFPAILHPAGNLEFQERFAKEVIARWNECSRENEKPCPWVRTAKRKPTKSDADCEGQIWTWQEYFSENEETAQMESIGFRVQRHGWMSVARHDRFAAPFWKPTGFTTPIPPVPEGQQAPVDTAVQPKQV